MYIYFDASLSFDVSKSVCAIMGSTSRTNQLHLMIMYIQVVSHVIVLHTLDGHKKDETLFASKQSGQVRQGHPVPKGQR
jgi:hypothetical protein